MEDILWLVDKHTDYTKLRPHTDKSLGKMILETGKTCFSLVIFLLVIVTPLVLLFLDTSPAENLHISCLMSVGLSSRMFL